MHSKPTFFLLILTLFLGSCVSEIVIPVEGEGKLYVETDLSRSSSRIEARLSTVTNFSDVTNIVRPEDAKIRLLSGVDIELEFDFDESTGVYFIPRSKHIIQPSWTYRLTAQLTDDENANVMTAKTSIPSLVKFGKESSADVLRGPDVNEVTMDLELPTEGFFRVKAYRILKSMEDGLVVTSKGQHEALEFTIGAEDPLAYHTEKHNYGVLVDANRLDNVSLTYHDKAMESSLADQYIVELQHLTEPSYRYHLSKSKQIYAVETGSASDPVINYTNIQGGLGILGAYASYTDTLSIR